MQENFLNTIDYALETQDMDLFSFLLKDFRSFRKKDKNQILIRTTINSQNTDFIEKLLSLGADINARDDDGYTAFLNAARWQSNSDVLDLLMEANADVFATTSEGENAFYLATRNENEEIASYLASLFMTSETAKSGTSCLENALMYAESPKTLSV